MKKTFLIYVFVLLSISLKSQIGIQIVKDPTNLAELQELVKTGAEQTKSVNEQLAVLKEAKENVETVNSYLKGAMVVDKAIKQSKGLIDLLNTMTNGVSKMSNLSPAYITSLTTMLNNNYVDVNSNVLELTDLLTDGKLKLNDSERMKLVDDKLNELHLIEVKSRKAYTKALSINNMSNTLGN